MPSEINISAASAARSTAAETVSRSSALEAAEHVIRKIAAAVAAPHADAHARKRLRREGLNHRLQPVVPAGAAFAPRPQPPQRQRHIVGDDEHVGRFDLVEPGEPGHRLPAEVHERQRLGDEHRLVADHRLDLQRLELLAPLVRDPPPLARARRRP